MDPAAGEREAVAFVLKLGRGLHAAGDPSHRLEGALAAVSRRLGLEGHFFSLPTALFASFGDEQEQRSFQVRVEPAAVNLERLARLHDVASAVARGTLSPAVGFARVDAIEAAPAPYGALLSTLAFSLSSGAAARFLGGGWADVQAAALIGLALGLLALLAAWLPSLSRVFEPAAAVAAAFVAGLLSSCGLPLSQSLATLAGLIVLIPGFSLTVALTEIATRHLTSGTARLMGALGTFLSIGFGVVAGSRLAALLPGLAPASHAPAPMPEWSLWLALLVAPLGFVVLLRCPPRDAWVVLVSGALAFLGGRAGALLLGPEIGAFVGALVVGIAGNLYGRVFDRPSSIPIVPGLLLLVPGSIGYQSFASLVDRATLSGVESAFEMLLSAVALVMGLLFANVLVQPRGLGEAQALPR